MYGIATCHILLYSPCMIAFISHLMLDKCGVEAGFLSSHKISKLMKYIFFWSKAESQFPISGETFIKSTNPVNAYFI
jgi:hypothetical protein